MVRRVFRLLVLAASLTTLSCKSWQPAGTAAVPELPTSAQEPSREANGGHPSGPNYKRSLESTSSQVAHNLSTPVASQPPSAPVVLHTTLSGISVTAVTFDSRTHRLAIADQAGGPGSRWADAAAAGRDLSGITAVNAAPGSGQLKNAAKTRRWALEEMGRNSVSPWMRPRTTASKMDTRFGLSFSGVAQGRARAHSCVGSGRLGPRHTSLVAPRPRTGL